MVAGIPSYQPLLHFWRVGLCRKHTELRRWFHFILVWPNIVLVLAETRYRHQRECGSYFCQRLLFLFWLNALSEINVSVSKVCSCLCCLCVVSTSVWVSTGSFSGALPSSHCRASISCRSRCRYSSSQAVKVCPTSPTSRVCKVLLCSFWNMSIVADLLIVEAVILIPIEAMLFDDQSVLDIPQPHWW